MREKGSSLILPVYHLALLHFPRDGKKGSFLALPWNLPADMEHFKALTKNKPIIMGSKTFESIGMALPKRDNIILTRDSAYKAPGCKLAYSIKQAVELARESELFIELRETMICGGASIYAQFLPMADKMYLTFIDADFDGDSYFPEFSQVEWKEIEKENHKAEGLNLYDYSFTTLEKIKE